MSDLPSAEDARLVVVGQSHVAALWVGALQESAGVAEAPDVAPIRLRRCTSETPETVEALFEITLGLQPPADGTPQERLPLEEQEGDWTKDWTHQVEISASRAADAGAAAVLWKGFQIDALALILVGPRFDISVDDQEEPNEESVLVPRSAVRDALHAMLDLDLYRQLLRTLGEVVPANRLLVLGPPPPVAASLVRQRLLEDGRFRTRAEQLGLKELSTVRLVEDPVRHKLWRMLLDVHQNVATELGARFVPPPLSSVGDDGTLRPEYVGSDDHHANGDYGRLYLTDVVEALGSSA